MGLQKTTLLLLFTVGFSSRLARRELSDSHFYTLTFEGKTTCHNSQKLAQPCNAGRGTACTVAECQQHCIDDSDCRYVFRINNGGCITYDECSTQRSAYYGGKTYQLIRASTTTLPTPSPTLAPSSSPTPAPTSSPSRAPTTSPSTPPSNAPTSPPLVKLARRKLSDTHFYTLTFEGHTTCHNSQKLAQPCNAGRGTGCTVAECQQHCIDDSDCRYVFRIDNGGCITYDECSTQRSAFYEGKTYQLIRSSAAPTSVSTTSLPTPSPTLAPSSSPTPAPTTSPTPSPSNAPTSPPFVGDVWVNKACEQSASGVVGSFISTEETAGVMCCALDGSYCSTERWCAFDAPLNYNDAVAYCASEGWRLCSKEEVSSNFCCGADTTCDDTLIWTSDVKPSSSPSTSLTTTPTESPSVKPFVSESCIQISKLPSGLEEWGGVFFPTTHDSFDYVWENENGAFAYFSEYYGYYLLNDEVDEHNAAFMFYTPIDASLPRTGAAYYTDSWKIDDDAYMEMLDCPPTTQPTAKPTGSDGNPNCPLCWLPAAAGSVIAGAGDLGFDTAGGAAGGDVIDGGDEPDDDDDDDDDGDEEEEEEETTPRPTTTKEPTPRPTPRPTREPSPSPTNEPTPSPTREPTPSPTDAPSDNPSKEPTPSPTSEPTDVPTTTNPSDVPTASPSTTEPSMKPSSSPTSSTPTRNPTTSKPSRSPSESPSTSKPSSSPTSSAPSQKPSTLKPSGTPSQSPTTDEPSNSPTSSAPSYAPTRSPSTVKPSNTPTTEEPTVSPSGSPTTATPTQSPSTGKPSNAPTTEEPTVSPSGVPTTATPTRSPSTGKPSNAPTTEDPTVAPSGSPTTATPTQSPSTGKPSNAPTTEVPTVSPSGSPTTADPTQSPSTGEPSNAPTSETPTVSPSGAPTTEAPTQAPSTSQPSSVPTSGIPTVAPTVFPSVAPTGSPTTTLPTYSPSVSPTEAPTAPTVAPTPDCYWNVTVGASCNDNRNMICVQDETPECTFDYCEQYAVDNGFDFFVFGSHEDEWCVMCIQDEFGNLIDQSQTNPVDTLYSWVCHSDPTTTETPCPDFDVYDVNCDKECSGTEFQDHWITDATVKQCSEWCNNLIPECSGFLWEDENNGQCRFYVGEIKVAPGVDGHICAVKVSN